MSFEILRCAKIFIVGLLGCYSPYSDRSTSPINLLLHFQRKSHNHEKGGCMFLQSSGNYHQTIWYYLPIYLFLI
jgi:hypothetical protein